MPESNSAERSDRSGEKVSGAKVIAQALKAQVRWRKRPLRRPAGARALSWRRGGRGTRGTSFWRLQVGVGGKKDVFN
jgi:hypothetical protein